MTAASGGESFVIRKATAEDAAPLTTLARRAKATWGYPPEWLEMWDSDLTISADYLVRHLAFVAEREGVALGCCVLEHSDGAAQLEHVWIDPDVQRQGVGRALVDRALDAARDAGVRSVMIVADPHAVGFYQRAGATHVADVSAPMQGAPERTLPLMEIRLPIG